MVDMGGERHVRPAIGHRSHISSYRIFPCIGSLGQRARRICKSPFSLSLLLLSELFIPSELNLSSFLEAI